MLKPERNYNPKEICIVLRRLVLDAQKRAANGKNRREEIKKQLESGKPLNNYRYDWLKEMANKIIDLMGNEAELFNKKYQSDMITAQDIMDVLSTAAHMVNNHSKPE